MAEFKVSAQKVELLEHPNAERLAIAKVGQYSLVVGKDNGYQNGDIIFFAPERSLLPDEIKGNYANADTGISYLSGPEQNRVKSIKLRGEPSEGVTLNRDWVLSKLGLQSIEDVELDVDLSEKLGITKYEPQVPAAFAGNIEVISEFNTMKKHDCENIRLYVNEFVQGEEVIMTEKIHGSQINILRTNTGRYYLTSKGIAKQNFAIQESEGNFYWRAFNLSGLRELLDNASWSNGHEIQLIGEAVPCQKGYDYGFTQPYIVLFRMLVDGREISIDDIINSEYCLLMVNWAPELYRGPFDLEVLESHAKGMETMSGKQRHIREGGVVSPVIPRYSKEGFKLFIKIINPKYKNDDEAFS